MPVMTLVLFLTGDISKIAAYPHWSSSGFLLSFFAVVFSGCIFTYSMFLCTTVNSALTTSCVSVLKSAVTTSIGIFWKKNFLLNKSYFQLTRLFFNMNKECIRLEEFSRHFSSFLVSWVELLTFKFNNLKILLTLTWRSVYQLHWRLYVHFG